ncbi:unnamed protein product [Heterobilharzia americana]|nr:unnamed protein product [Heterobilharzia americana]
MCAFRGISPQKVFRNSSLRSSATSICMFSTLLSSITRFIYMYIYRILLNGMKHKSLDHSNSLTSEGKQCNYDCSLLRSGLEQLSRNVKRASSLGSDDITQIIPNCRPSSLSMSSAVTDSHSLPLQEGSNTKSSAYPDSCITQADLSTSELQKNLQSSRSVCEDQAKNYLTCSVIPASYKIQRQQTDTNSFSVASSVSYAIPFYRHGNNDSQLSPYFPSHFSNYDGHSIPSNLLRLKSSFIGQSAPNLLHYMRDPNYNEFLNCRNSYLHMSSTYTPPSDIKSSINPNAPGLHTSESPKGEEVAAHSNKHSCEKSPLSSTSVAIRNTNENTRTLTSLPFHAQRRSMLVSGLGSLSGSSGCMADRSMSSPAPSNEPGSPFFSAASFPHNDMVYFLSPKNHIVTCESQLAKSSEHSGDPRSQPEISYAHQVSGQLQDKSMQQPIIAQTNHNGSASKHISDTGATQQLYDTSLTEKRSFPLRLPLVNKHTVDSRRWSIASLPSSGYGTNTSESGSHLSRSRCSSRENISHVPPVQTSVQHLTGLTASGHKKSPSTPVSSHLPSSVSPLSFSSSVSQNEASSSIYSRSPKDSYTSETGFDNSPLNVSSPLCAPVCGVDSKSVPLTPVARTSPRIAHVSTNGSQICLNSVFGSCRTRSRSLSPLRVSNVGGEQDILLLNHVYRERFPKASAHMQDQLASLADEMENMDTVSCCTTRSGLSSKGSFWSRNLPLLYEMTENLGKLIEDTRARDADSIPLVVTFVRRLLLIIARPARLLECLEFDPSEFYQLLEVAENHVHRRTHSVSLPGSQIVSADVPLYIISKLGLSKTALDESHNIESSRICRSDIDGSSHLEKFKPDSTVRTRTTSGSNLETCVNAANEPVVRTARSSSSYAPIRPPCEADFEVIKLISNGAYGAVYLVRHRLRNQVEQVFAERDIMSFADNPFVVSLCCTFETKKCLCMVMEYVEGGDVATLLKHIGGPLPLDLARMYFAETVLALEYLHNYGIVHRDLKPDNLLITHEGHIKLTDFGLSRIGLMNLATNLYEKNLDLEKDCKMFRDKQGYGKPVDWWSMGIMLYEFLVGCVPFCGNTIEELFDNIITAPIDWPEEEEWKVTPSAVDIITRLLERDPLLRLGTVGGSSEVKETPFFSGPSAVDWNNLLRQKAAFVPQLEHDEDTSYFDPRTDRYQHDVENDEDIYAPMDYSSHSNRSSPAPQLSAARNFSFNSSTDHTLTSIIRRPAASRLGRAKQQAIEHKRSHSLGDSNNLFLHPFKSRSKSRSIRGSPINTPQSLIHSELSSSSSQRSLCYQKYGSDKVEHDLVTSTLTPESVAGRNALHMLQNLSLTSSNLGSSLSPKSTSDNGIHSQETSVFKNKLEKLNIDITKRESSDDEVGNSQNVSDESRTFQYFSSYSPRFSVVLEQARINELLQGNSNVSLNGSDNVNEKNPLHASSPRIYFGLSKDLNAKHSVTEVPKDCTLSKTDEQMSISDKQDIIPSDHICKEVSRSSDIQPSNTQDVPACFKSDQCPSKFTSSSVVVPSITHTATENTATINPNLEESGEWHMVSDVNEDRKSSESDSNSSLELSSYNSLIPSSINSSSVNESDLPIYQTIAPISSESAQNSPPKTKLLLDTAQSLSNTSNSSKSVLNSPSTTSFSLTTVTPLPTPHPDSCLSLISDGSASHKRPWFLNVDLKPEGELMAHRGTTVTTSADCHQRTTPQQLPPRLLLINDNSSRIMHPSSPPVVPNTPNVLSFLSNSPGVPRQAIIIHKGKQGYGFVFRAIRVFFGRSDAYTLHHLVIGVVPHGPAAKAVSKKLI